MKMEPLYRRANASDAECLAALALQVFFDTYAQWGIRPPVARYALTELSVEAFDERIKDPSLCVLVAEVDQHRVGFAVLVLAAESPVPGCPPAEVATLYVSRHFARRGIGRGLLDECRGLAAELSPDPRIWLSANAENAGAIAFYRRLGFNELGAFDFEIEGERHPNLVFVSPA
ncbi:GNAT family N-acetyltransferase [Niveibacterium terrae]|uniref:GNAT family N-acetyltransferase n=1 Tax=Niveibacterium terrae TaxID=3373598 RepID=UPI003A942086